ncbi:malate:quinone oxidoreductase [Shigella flexneri]
MRLTKHFTFSRQFWAHQVERGVLRTPRSFINTVPHMKLRSGAYNVNFLRARYAAL